MAKVLSGLVVLSVMGLIYIFYFGLHLTLNLSAENLMKYKICAIVSDFVLQFIVKISLFLFVNCINIVR